MQKIVLVSLFSVGVGILFSGCATSTSHESRSLAAEAPQIYSKGGIWGYDVNGAFCTHLNNYCDTDLPNGISVAKGGCTVYKGSLPQVLITEFQGSFGYFSDGNDHTRFCNSDNNFCSTPEQPGCSFGLK